MSRFFALWLLAVTSQSFAQGDFIDDSYLTLHQAAERVLKQNPRLRSAQFGRAAVDASIRAASLTPQWSVELDVEDVLGSGSRSGFDGGQSTLRLSRIFQSDEALVGRVAVASAIGGQTNDDIEAERLDTLTSLARRYTDVVHLQESVRLAEQSVEVWEAALELALSRERAGAAPAVDRLRTEVRVTGAALALENAEHELQAARMLLAATWGSSAPDFGRASGSLCRLSELPEFDLLAAELNENPDLLRFATEQRLRAAEAQLARARQRPDWTLSAGVRHLAATDEQAIVLSMSVPFGSRSRTVPDIRRANALAEQSALQEQAFEVELQARLFDVYQEVLHAAREVEAFDDEILPGARSIRTDIEEGYVVGRFSHTDFVNAQAELLAAAAARIDACADHHRLLIDIERLTGGDSIWLTTNAEDPP